jgi:uracil-DNA glycosylase
MVHNDWYPWLQEEFRQPYFEKLAAFVHEAYARGPVYPPKQQVFSAFEHCDLPAVRVVILGQDPYHQRGQAHGMCFSVNPGVPIPPSLQNIFKELQDDLGCRIPNNGYLMPWAEQGVFLLNTVMTVEDSHPNSHAGRGWETFTDHAIQKINDQSQPVVFLLWGRNAAAKRDLIDSSRHLVLQAAHPSPLSAYHGFFGCRHFSQANAWLQAHGGKPIDWQIPDLHV